MAVFLAGAAIYHILKEEKIPDKQMAEPQKEKQNVKLTKEAQEQIGLKIIRARFAQLNRDLAVTGQVAQDVESLAHVTAPQSGIIVESRAQIGSVVEKDEVLGAIKTNGDDSLSEIKSPISGVITGDFAKIGDKVDPVSSIYAVADMSKLWANFDVYEKDISEVKIGQKISIHAPAYPDKLFSGKIIFISPRVDETTRTIKIRAAVNNPGYLLKLGMFVEGNISIKSPENYLILPTSALQTIGDKKIVFVKINSEEFTANEVVIKAETRNEAAVSSGIKEGDSVVSEGAFILKSEQLKDEIEGE
jgi:multidrug efflux pump subunit AcrA (membrane-fusion protein)